MSNKSTCCRLSVLSQRGIAWSVLFALLLIQVKVAVGGCLVPDYLPPLQKSEQGMQMKTAGDPCTGHSSSGKQLCIKHCEQSSNTPSYAFDLPLFAPAVLPAGAPLFIMAASAGYAPPAQPAATAGPPPYLRFLRLLN